MKKLTFLTTMLAALLMLASCSKKEAAMLVPDDATIVFRLDIAKGAQKSGLMGNDSEAKKWIKKQVKSTGMEKEMRDKLLAIIDDPTKSGIDFRQPVYIYMAGDMERDPEVGFVATMASKSDMIQLLESLDAPDIEEADGGIRYCEVDRDAAIIFCDDWFFGGKVDDVDDMIASLKERADGKGTLEGHKAFGQMCSKSGIAQMLFLFEGLEDLRDFKEMKEQMSEVLPDGVEMKDMAVISDFDMNPGEMTFTAETVALTKECEDYFQQSLAAMKDIDASQAKYISDRGLSFFINVDLKKYLKQMGPLAALYGLDDETVELIEDIADNADGSFALDFFGLENGNPLFTAYLGTKNSDLLGMVLQQVGDVDEFEEVGDDQYVVPTDYDYDWDSDDFQRVPTAWAALGFKNGMTYLSTDRDNVFATPTKKFPTSEIKGKGAYLRFNADFFNELAKQSEGSDQKVLKALADIFDSAEMYYGGKMTGVFRIAMKDKKKMPLESIADLVKDFLN